MARKVNTSKEKRRNKRKDRVDYTRETMAKLKVLEQAEKERNGQVLEVR